MRIASDLIAKRLSRLVLSIFFRVIEVEGVERVPSVGPVVFVVNHPNSIVDPMLVLGFLPRNPRFLARHGLWKMLPMRPLLALAGAIPVYRPDDPGADGEKNVQMFSRCHEELAKGATVALFPEGISHTESALQPLKTGAARIVLEADKFGERAIPIVPVGLTFDDKERFRSRVLLRVGEPVDSTPEWEAHRRAPKDAVRALTARLDDALRGVTLNYGSWQGERRLRRAAQLYARQTTEMPTRRELSHSFDLQKAFSEGYATIKRHAPNRVAELERQVDRYDRLLRFTGISDAQIASTYPTDQVARYAIRMIGLLFVRLPVAIVGSVLNWLPYRIADWVARPYGATPDKPASKKVVAGLFAFPITWAAETMIAWRFWGGGSAIAVAIVAPLSGYVAMGFHEDRSRFTEEIQVYLKLRRHHQTWDALRDHRAAICAKVIDLADTYAAISRPQS